LSVDGIVGPQTWAALVITLQEGSSGYAVTALQRQLKYTYWYSLDVDGDFGPETLSKVEAFQSDIGIDVDGIVGPITWRYLLGSESGSDAGDSSDSESIYWPTLRSGSQGEDVYTLQYLLTARGYSLAIDGSFGPETYSNVIAFQTARGLSIDGVVGPQTWGALVITLQEGSSGHAVTALQRQLKNTFGYLLSVDGDFGPETLSKVEAFQSKAGIDVDGIVGPITWCYLLGLNGGTPAEDPEDPNVDDGSIAPWTRILKEGMNGNDVKELQIRIAGWAADSASQTYLVLDGDFGPATKAALMRFQKAYGLTIDGIMGPETQAKLNSLEDSDGSTAHFAWSEYYSKDGSGFTGGSVSATVVKENVRRLMWKLEALRKKAGNNPITVTSGFRSISHNAAVGGASNSMHTYGIAADIKISGVSVASVNSYARTCGFSGIIRYSTFNHLDSRMEYPYGAQFWYWAIA